MPSSSGMAYPPFSSALDVLPYGVWLSGSDHLVAYCNPLLCEILGLDESEVQGKAWQSFFHVANATSKGYQHALTAAAEAGHKVCHILECLSAEQGTGGSSSSSSTTTRSLRVTVIPMPGNPATCYMGMVEDVTQAHAQEDLQHLITSGIACSQHGISVVEVLHPPPSASPSPRSGTSSRNSMTGDSSFGPHSSQTQEQQAAGQRQIMSHALDDGGDAAQLQQGQMELGRVLYANPALEQMLGHQLHELQGKGLGALLGPASNGGDVQRLMHALQSGTSSTVKLLCYHKDGRTTMWTSITLTPINQLPFTTAAWVTHSSISPPPASPSRCPGSATYTRTCSREMMLEATLSPSPAPHGSTPALTAHHTALAAAMSRLACVSPPPRAAGGEASTAMTAALARSGSGGAAGLITATDLAFHSSSAAAGAEDSEGAGAAEAACSNTPVHYMCVIEDISARVSEEMGWSLREHALSSCSEGIAIADPSQPDAPLVYVNDAFLQITGYRREDVLGRNCRFLQGPDTSREAVSVLREAVAARRKATVELINYKKNGEKFWNRLSITPVFNDAGALVSYIGVQSDVTELMRRKEEEQRLLEAKVAAETATEAKSMFLANMSHEIRTPLNGMMATAQLLLGSALTPEQRELAETILESGNSLLGILGDILDFSKLDHGAITLQREPMCLRRSIEACIEIVAPDANKKGLAVAYTADAEALASPLVADPIRVRQVLVNFLSNAVKFTEKGEIHIDVKLEALPATSIPEGHEGASSSSSSGGGAAAAVAAAAPSQQAGSIHVASSVVSVGSAPGTSSYRGSLDVASTCVDPSSSSLYSISDPAASSTNSQQQQQQALMVGQQLLQASSSSNPGAPLSVKSAGVPDSPLLNTLEEEEEAWAAAVQIRRYSLEDGLSQERSSAPTVLLAPHSSSNPTSPRAHHTSGVVPSIGRPTTSAPPTSVGVDDDAPTANVSLTAAGASPSTSRVHISVQDTGIGITPDLVGSLFQCFKQGSETMARRYGGTGLGLAISRRLAELMQGCVWVESEGKGKGSTFHFCVPAEFCLPHALPPPQHSSCGCPSEATPGAASRSSSGSSTASAATASSWASSGEAAGTSSSSLSYNNTLGQPFNVLSTDEHLVLHGRRVLVDIHHQGTARQVQQSCSFMGMKPSLGDACSAASGAGLLEHEMLVVSVERAPAALRAGWKGRPVVAVGARDALPPNLQPLVVVVQMPVLHARLANALTKSTVLLKWGPGSRGGSQGPKLAHQPISPAQLADFKSWRDRGRSPAGVQLQPGGIPLHIHGHAGGAPSAAAESGARGLYMGGQLAVSAAAAAAAAGPSQMAGSSLGGGGGYHPFSGAPGFADGFVRPSRYDLSMLARRSSLDNSSLDRALVQQMLASSQARAAAAKGISASGSSSTTSVSASPLAPAAAGQAWAGEASSAASSAAASCGSMRRCHGGSGLSLPKAIPENTVLLHEEEGSGASVGAGGLASASTANSIAAAPIAAATTTPLGATFSSQGAAATAPPRVGSSGSNGLGMMGATGAAAAGAPPLRILIAEDNKVNQKVVLKVLQQISGGATTDVVENGLQVLKALETKTYDLILMDIHMPEMDGLEATRRIVATYPPMLRPRIIALSADTLQALHERCKEAGIEEFIVKPFRVEDLKRVMQTSSRLGRGTADHTGGGQVNRAGGAPTANPPAAGTSVAAPVLAS